MILTATSSRRPSRLAFWIVLGLGAMLLPLAPGAEKPGPRETERPVEQVHYDVDRDREILHTHGVQSCVACHEAQSVHAHELLRKPKSWKEAHEEIIRLMDEVRRRQAQLRETARYLPLPPEVDRSEEIQKLQDAIELLKLQVQLKEVRRTGTQARLKEAHRRLENLMAINKKAPGTIPTDTIQETRMTETTLAADAAVEEIELKEALVRLKQAERRLVRLQRPSDKIDGGDRTQQEKRLRELQQKVETLLKEIEKLRKEIQPDKPRGPGQTSAIPSKEDWIWQNIGLRLHPLGAPLQAKSGEFRGGMLVEAVRPTSPAWGSGLRTGDILVGLHKSEVLSKEDIHAILTRPELRGDAQDLKFYYLRGGKLESSKFSLGN